MVDGKHHPSSGLGPTPGLILETCGWDSFTCFIQSLGNLVSSTVRRSQAPDTSLPVRLTSHPGPGCCHLCLDHCHPLLTGFLLLLLFFTAVCSHAASSCVCGTTRQTSSALRFTAPRHPPQGCPTQSSPGRHHGPYRLLLTSWANLPCSPPTALLSCPEQKQAHSHLRSHLRPMPLGRSSTAGWLTASPLSPCSSVTS